MNWRFAYAIGFHPWEDAAADAGFVQKAAEVFAREEEGAEDLRRLSSVSGRPDRAAGASSAGTTAGTHVP